MNCNDICIFMRQLWVSLGLFSRAVRSHDRHVYVHNNNVVRINLQMLLVKDCSRELYRR